MRIPLEHDVGEVGQPDRSVPRQLAVAVAQHLLVPGPVGRRAGPAQVLVDADRLHRVPLAELPAQVVARDEAAQPRVERDHVVVLEVDLDEGLPVVVALVDLDVIEQVAREVELRDRIEAGEIARHVARALEEHAAPVLQGRTAEVSARTLLEVRRPEQLAGEIVGPAVQRAHDVRGLAAAVEHHRLPVAADVGQQLDARGVAHQDAALVLGRQRVVAAGLGHHQLVADVARPVPEQGRDLPLVQRFVEIGGDGELRARRSEMFATTQIRHPDPPCKVEGRSQARPRECPGTANRRVRMRREGEGYPDWQARQVTTCRNPVKPVRRRKESKITAL